MGSDFLTMQRDGLTNLFSRSHFLYAVAQAMPNAPTVSILLVNLDRFRMVNEHFSYADGDIVLRETAKRIVAVISSSATASRLCADEFAVALIDVDQDGAQAMAERIRLAIAEPHHIAGTEVIVTASVGIARGSHPQMTAEQLLRQADAAVRCAKQLGSNQVRTDCARPPRELPPLMVETMLRHALRNRDLQIYYQPKVHAKSMQVVGAEALCRWRHPELGDIPPHAFIPIAESSDLILPIDEYVLRAVCEQGSSWLRQGYRVRTSVNISSRQFLQPSFPQLVQQALAESGLDPSLLELEITERTAMYDVERAVHILTQLRQIGVRIAIDDFGVGYSSLNYLMQFPVHTLKIDRSFTAGIQSAVNQTPIIGAIISLAKSLNLSVVAEGVETVQQFDFLRDSKCDEIQGYLFGAPVPPTSFQLSAFIATLQPRQPHLVPDDTHNLERLSEREWLDAVLTGVQRHPRLHELTSYLADAIVEQLPLDRLSLEFVEEGAAFSAVHEVSLRDDVPARPVGTLIPVTNSGVAFVQRTKQPVMCADILRNPEFQDDYSLAAQGIQSIIRVPLLRGNHVFGTMNVQSTLERVYTEADRNRLQRTAQRLSDAVYAAYQDTRRPIAHLYDAKTKLYHRQFLVELLAADQPAEWLSQTVLRPFPEWTTATAVVVSIANHESMDVVEGEQAVAYIGQCWSTHAVPNAVAIRMGAGEVLFIAFDQPSLSVAQFVHQLRSHIELLNARAERLGDSSLRLEVNTGQASGDWCAFWDVYVDAREQALVLQRTNA
ncbi:diguanylate cyclase (GGDEF) domain-containing protein [Alicyclobacillus hesperidum]|uniref:Diguanylate cyclase (GGDEF) domain-containing protein n=1 Tax=Alicyclobacillus hesperidum TaxID=89784 RepID=A0A1H2Q1M2_9BACL|nr:EAL domain-containing protein [Alicyclobacillus hesperidum]SDW01037.1 diguanylate cyclase (GGDEF) domain-containing protein [Alicyclobacillus hesperidum]